MLKFLLALALAFLPSSFQTKCTLKIVTPPYSPCQDEHWAPAILEFSPDEKIELPIDSICHNGSISVNTISVQNTTDLANGYFRFYQLDKGPILDGRVLPKWFIEQISVDCEDGVSATFGIARSVETSRWYDFSNYDTGLSLDSCSGDQQATEIGNNKKDYLRTQAYENGPYWTRRLNAENAFEFFIKTTKPDKVNSSNYILYNLKRLYVDMMTQPSFTSFEDYNNFILNTGFPKPDVMDYWANDWHFDAQRLQGANPILIKMIQEIPESFNLDLDRAYSIMNGEEIYKVMLEKRMFLIDLDILLEVDFYAPMALFFVNQEGEFKTLAIQLTRGGDNLVFYPDDEPNDWLLAKMYYNNAEALQHQLVSHLCQTHGILDGIGTMMYQHIPPSHPVFKIIKPHLYMLFGNNLFGAYHLMAPNDLLDNILTNGAEIGKKLLSAAMERNSFEIFHPILNDEQRQTSSIKIYPYRDQGIPIFNAIKQYVEDVMKNYYEKNRSPAKDEYLKNWRKALSRPDYCQGVALSNLPGSDETGEMNRKELIELVASIIWQASGGHAALHNSQYHQYGYPLNYCLALKLPPPNYKNISTSDIVSRLPTKKQTFSTIALMYSFTFDGKGPHIGEFDRQFLHAPKDQAVIDRYKNSMDSLMTTEYEGLPGVPRYTYLDIDTIRNSPRV